jgi:hypothetical protein
MQQYSVAPINTSHSSSRIGFGIINILFVILGLFAIYYLYRYLYTSGNTTATTLVGGEQSAGIPPSNVPKPPTPFEGGEYSVNTWVYISSFNKNINTRKHILEIQGDLFSSLLIGLGAFKNTLIVRTHTDDPVVSTDGFQSGGRGSGSGSGRGSNTHTITTTAPPGTEQIGSLSSANVDAIFAPIAMQDDILTTPAICDLPEIDLQRWIMITVVLSGRTIDVYMDGKLARSCTTSSYYKVDPTGVTMNILDRGGFDGYIGNTVAAAHSMNPDEIYRAYLSGPNGSSMDVLQWIQSLFLGAKTN